MAGHAAEGHILGIKKLGGLLLVILGCLLIAAAVSAGYTSLSVAGGVLVALGVVLLVLKIVRRNRPA
jgi:Flp pilus assembly protein TadB